jgi:hypothetical protein
MKLTLSTLADSVPPESLDEHRETIQEIREESAWSLLLPAGDRHPQQRGDFATLPASCDPTFSMPVPSEPRLLMGTQPGRDTMSPQTPASDNGAPKNAATPPPSAPPEAQKSKRRRHRRKREKGPAAKWFVVGCCVMSVVLILIVFLVAKNADHWRIFKLRAAPPATPLTTFPQ